MTSKTGDPMQMLTKIFPANASFVQMDLADVRFTKATRNSVPTNDKKPKVLSQQRMSTIRPESYLMQQYYYTYLKDYCQIDEEKL